jgi:poly(3-hydroxybutyrate) depolymerase
MSTSDRRRPAHPAQCPTVEQEQRHECLPSIVTWQRNDAAAPMRVVAGDPARTATTRHPHRAIAIAAAVAVVASSGGIAMELLRDTGRRTLLIEAPSAEEAPMTATAAATTSIPGFIPVGTGIPAAWRGAIAAELEADESTTSPVLPTSHRPPTAQLRRCPRRGVADDIRGQRLTVSGYANRPTVLTLDGNATDALVVVFHGQHSCIEMVQSQLDLAELTPAYHVNVLWLSGAPLPNRSWNTNGRCCEPASTAGVDDYAYVTAALDTALVVSGLHPHITIAAGISNGAGMAIGASCRYPHRFDAVVAVAGWIPQGCAPARISLVTVGGTADEVLGATVAGHNASTWSRTVLACPDPPEVSRVGAATVTAWRCADGTFVRLVQLAGVGHVWPTYDSYDADDEILRIATGGTG